MKSTEIRDRFLRFFEERNHAIIPSASLVPENDSSVLFTTAGMQPLVPFLLGQKHPEGNRVVNVQKCVRTNDIDEVGDATHLTFFQMLGNWSFGDYFKKEAIQWSYEFLTNKEEGLGLDPERLYITVFEGNEDAPEDVEAIEFWQQVGVPGNRIYSLEANTNWWSPGPNGPSGPNSEMFYDTTVDGLGDLTKEEFLKADDDQKVVEIWNDVFMQYEKKDGKVISKLSQHNVDTGAGLERLAAVKQGVKSVFETDMFKPVIDLIKERASNYDEKSARVMADHLRASIFLISDGVSPSNKDQGYILRRLLRRSINHWERIREINDDRTWGDLINLISDQYSGFYTNINLDKVTEEIMAEYARFSKTLSAGIKELDKLLVKDISGEDAFKLFATHGFPLELTTEIASDKGFKVDSEGFSAEMEKHQKASGAGSQEKFKGGLADTSEISVKYHTATHLLHAALRDILGDHVEQKGSNINPDRLRFDFSHPAKMTEEEKESVEDWVNQKIADGISVNQKFMSKEDALKSGAIGLFADKYGDEVSVYSIGDDEDFISREFCGGPHVENTNVLGSFRIKKEESVSAGVRRIKAVLE